MALLDNGAILIAQLLKGASVTPLNAANAHIAVGNGNTAFSASQTDLVGASKERRPMDSGYPSGSSNVLTFQSTYSTSQGNFEWVEWGIGNALSGGTLVARKVESPSLGTKDNTKTWTFQAACTVSAT